MRTSKKSLWKRGRGKLGVLDLLLGAWEVEAGSPRGPVRCTMSWVVESKTKKGWNRFTHHHYVAAAGAEKTASSFPAGARNR